jgi:2,4-dienoyl-CoA reductase (NADPH2)
MSDRFARLLSPVQVGPFELRNRVVMGAMHTRLERADRATERLVEFYRARAAGGVALIVTGGHSPTPEGRLDEESPWLDGIDDLEQHRQVCEAVHQEGARIVLQLLHAGRYARVPDPVAPSPVRSSMSTASPRELTTAEVHQLVAAFASAAAYAVRAGYDGIEVMGSEGYLLNQFTAPRTNTRTDSFGGSAHGRRRFPVDVVRAVRTALGPDHLLIYRISALDLVDGATSPEEVRDLAGAVEGAGADAISMGLGWHESPIPTVAAAVPHAAWSFASRALREAVSVPVIAANRINSPEIAEGVLDSGAADLVSLARPLLADPDFVTKARRGAEREIVPCIACNQSCLDHVLTGVTASCLVNPLAAREIDFPRIRPRPKRICVVGAGPAGMSCAVASAELGHDVTLLEAEHRLGGQLNLAARIPGKSDFGSLIRSYEARLAAAGVRVEVGSPATRERLREADYDAVVLATGVRPRRLDLPGIDHPMVLTYEQALEEGPAIGRRVVIMGAGAVGLDVAAFLTESPAASLSPGEFLRTWGGMQLTSSDGPSGDDGEPAPGEGRRDVVVLQRSTRDPFRSLGRSTGWILKKRLARAGVRIVSGVDYHGIDDSGVHCLTASGPEDFAADTVVVCAGQESARDLLGDLEVTGVPIHVVGGARAAAGLDAARAIREAVELAWAL